MNKVSCNDKDNQIVASVSNDEKIIIWDLKTNKASLKISSSSRCNLNTVKWFEEKIVFVGNDIGEIISYDIRNHSSPLFTKKISTSPIKEINVSRDETAIGSDDKNVYLFKSLFEENSQQLLFSHTDFVRTIDFDPFQKNTLASGSWDKNICILEYTF